MLLPVIERVVVALQTLQLLAKEQSGHSGCGGQSLVIDVSQQEIGGPVFFVIALSRDELFDDYVPLEIVRKALSQKFL
jgi:hypothetical protein